MFGEQVDLQIEVGAAAFFFGLAVLRDEQKRRKENRFDRRPHRQNDELRVELRPVMRQHVPRDPAAKQDEVQINEPHAAREARDGVRHLFFRAKSRFFALAARASMLRATTGSKCGC